MSAGGRLPKSLAPVLFAALLSGCMSLIVSGVATAKVMGIVAEGLVARWLSSWLMSWAIAFPAVLVIAPIVRKIVAALTEPQHLGDPLRTGARKP